MTGTKDPEALDVLYVENLVAAYTVNTIPEKTLRLLPTMVKLENL